VKAKNKQQNAVTVTVAVAQLLDPVWPNYVTKLVVIEYPMSTQ